MLVVLPSEESVEKRLNKMGFPLPDLVKPVAAYVPAVATGNLVFTAGQLPFINGMLAYHGKLGDTLSIEDGYIAARICALNCLAAIKSITGDLDRIVRVVKVTGYVNCAPGFTNQPAVINGASELFGQLFGSQGEHARSAVGVAELPMNATVEVEVIVEVAM
ncbi:RidA family protein [Heliobacterium chlorum]|uniref:RidA family protein n=1 Tax=Heliobacterium chlorum TaxID=2698 RepID=A0ABR7T956_HELCL|nr:RidA family protein [Heliobacterium chlorum]MBC9786371.1 RidA family protein [Heliobacterium chlorum]